MKIVVLADRNPDARRIVSDYLTVQGYAVRCCDTGEELLAEIAELRPLAVIVELFDLGPGGLPLVRDIATGRHGPAVPVLLYTSDPRRSLARELGTPMVRLLTKPATPREVLRALESLLHPDVPDAHVPSDPGIHLGPRGQ